MAVLPSLPIITVSNTDKEADQNHVFPELNSISRRGSTELNGYKSQN